MKPLRRPRMKSKKKKGRKERKLHSFAESPVGTSMRGIQVQTEKIGLLFLSLSHRLENKAKKCVQ
jgi:hypothetical protein